MTPCRASIASCRCSGRWSAYFAVTTWANRPGPGNPLSIGWAGFGAVTINAGGSGSPAGTESMAFARQTGQA